MGRSFHSDTVSHRAFAIRCFSRFGRLTPDIEEALYLSVGEAEHHPADVEVLAEGSILPKPRFLLSGWAARVRVLSDGRRQIFAFVLPGDLFGIATASRKAAPWDVVTLTNAVIAPLAPNFCTPGEETIFARAAAHSVRQDEIGLLNQVVRSGRLTAHERTAHLLLEIHERLEAVGLAENGRFRVPLTQDVLSDALGLSVVHTNRTLQRLKREGLIESHGTEVTLIDPVALARVSDAETALYLRRPDDTVHASASAQAP